VREVEAGVGKGEKGGRRAREKEQESDRLGKQLKKKFSG
jgi:hypothetical protein